MDEIWEIFLATDLIWDILESDIDYSKGLEERKEQ